MKITFYGLGVFLFFVFVFVLAGLAIHSDHKELKLRKMPDGSLCYNNLEWVRNHQLIGPNGGGIPCTLNKISE